MRLLYNKKPEGGYDDCNTGQTQAVFRTNLTQIAQLKEPVTAQHEMKRVC